MTLRELAEKNAGRPSPKAGGGLTLNVSAKHEPEPEPWLPALKAGGQEPRPLGAVCHGECLPMDWPEVEPEAVWEEARHGLPSRTVVVLSQCRQWAWLALLPDPNYPRKPILLHKWPVAGVLGTEAGGLATLESQPSGNSDGSESAPTNSACALLTTARNAGSVEAGHCSGAAASAPGPFKLHS